jgi:repressor LexA
MVDYAKDSEYLGKLQDYYARWRGLPSYNRLCEVLGMASRSAVGKVLRRLEKEGYLSLTPDDVWVPTSRFFGRKLADFRVPAGSPVSTGDVGSEEFAVDSYLVGSPSRTVFVPVRGESMVGAGILDGDVAVVEQGKEARQGDLVVAVVDGESTLKRLEVEDGKFILVPANPDYPVIRPKGALEVSGVVVGIVRKVRR